MTYNPTFKIVIILHWYIEICVHWQGSKIDGRKADVILAAHHAAEVALRMVKPGAEVCIIIMCSSILYLSSRYSWPSIWQLSVVQMSTIILCLITEDWFICTSNCYRSSGNKIIKNKTDFFFQRKIGWSLCIVLIATLKLLASLSACENLNGCPY